jgi:hypothetical protein
VIHKHRSNSFGRKYPSGRAWLPLIAAVVVGGGFSALVLLSPAFAGSAPHVRSRDVPVTANSRHSINLKMADCERHHAICNPAALSELPLVKPARASAVLLTGQQVLARFRQPGAVLATERTTYGQIHAADSFLAASTVVYPGRVVWVITRYFAKPVTVADSNAPAGTAHRKTISAESFVIDAATGQVTDYCLGCAAVPRPSP